MKDEDRINFFKNLIHDKTIEITKSNYYACVLLTFDIAKIEEKKKEVEKKNKSRIDLIDLG
jgi:glycerol-3-phosphate responsive antiterminator